jgi:PAS domain S-box-containing protein
MVLYKEVEMAKSVPSDNLVAVLVQASESEAALIMASLDSPGRAITSERIETAEAMRAALERRAWDVVIADTCLPGLGVPDALALLRSLRPDVPFIVVAGPIGEEAVAGLMRAGASDVILKSALARLRQAVEREMRAAAERRRQEAAEDLQRENERAYRLAAEASGDSVWTLAPDTLRLTSESPSLQHMLGRCSEELRGMTLGELIHPHCRRRVLGVVAEHQAAASSGPPTVRARIDRVQMLRADGAVVMTEMSLAVRRPSRDGPAEILVVSRDTTERDLRELQITKAQKMAAVSQLASGIAHDFNNLQVVQGYGRLAFDLTPPSGDARAHLEEVLRAAERARAVVGKLLTFSQKERVSHDPLDLEALVTEVAAMLRRLLGDTYLVTWTSDGTPIPVRADAAEIEQALVDLSNNAKEAMPSGGTVRVGLARTRLDAAFCRRNPWARPGDFAVLSVSDTGPGMSPEALEHLFEPFFTTKPHGRGTGLGLATVYGIARRHDGFPNVQSTPGKGTTVALYLPLTEPIASLDDPASRGRTLQGGTETILLAEDDESVRGFTVKVLQGAGYHVHAAADGAEAVRLFEASADAVDLAIIDVIMPRLSGTVVADRLRKLSPHLPVLFSTGYVFRLLEEGYVPSVNMEVIRKPFSHVELLRKVRDMIDIAR